MSRSRSSSPDYTRLESTSKIPVDVAKVRQPVKGTVIKTKPNAQPEFERGRRWRMDREYHLCSRTGESASGGEWRCSPSQSLCTITRHCFYSDSPETNYIPPSLPQQVASAADCSSSFWHRS
ncbi:hypothetical protein JAAARDRAFT_34021 [Jaapia argillacea MUCL 33604]|uniref:Uncharacterized protein n=1 Tax=Jaapia argillacea MUCL 33604 TaxID=933084 RepID=A0A067Q715_9AGAM|nr:hypothetical protein JAAARDRAFT_34021 [Jaapia argillacea MUCL 33604]